MNFVSDSPIDTRSLTYQDRTQYDRRLTFGKENLISFPQDNNSAFRPRDNSKHLTEKKNLINNFWNTRT